MENYQAREYQKVITDFILQKKRCAIFVKMGLGKTAATIAAIRSMLFDRFDAERILVVAPKRVASITWPDEMARWDIGKGIRVVAVDGSESDRLRALHTPADIYTLGRDNIVWLAKNYKWDFDALIVDESTSFKNQSSKRFKAISMFTPLCKYVVLLSGSPAPRGYENLWSQFFLLDRGQRLGKNITAYRNRYFTYDPHRFGYNLISGCDKVINARLQDLAIGMNNEKFLVLEKPFVNDIYTEMTPEVKKTYANFKRELVLQFCDSSGVVIAKNAGTLVSKLRQFSSGAVYDDKNVAHLIHEIKLDVFREVVEEAQGSPVLVFYNYTHEYERIRKAFPHARRLDSVKDIEDWNRGEVELAVCHPASVGHGLNMQFGGHIIVWFSLSTDLELYEQANARLVRPGQREPVIIHRILMRGTRDEQDAKLIQKKSWTQEDFLASIQVLLEN
jgi:SNF2 family DNA or RNA helicase